MKIFSILKHKISVKSIKFKRKGKNTHILGDCEFHSPSSISLGENVHIGARNIFYGAGGITIGDGTVLAHDVEIITMNHNYDSEDLKSIPYDRDYVFKPVTIEDNVWVGSHVLIVPGVTIGEGSVIGMGAVVTKDVPKGAVVGGNPAKVIKYRDMEKYNSLKEQGNIYIKMKYE